MTRKTGSRIVKLQGHNPLASQLPTALLCPALSEVGNNREKRSIKMAVPTEGTVVLEDTISRGPPVHPSLPEYRSAHGDRLKFRTFTNIEFRDALDQRYDNWSELFYQVKGSSQNTEWWDDAWYWTDTAPPSEPNRYIVMIACNLDANQYAAITLRNDAGGWAVFRSNAYPDPITIQQGYDHRLKFPYDVGGSTVEFDLWNPENDGGWTPNDMIISWGQP